MNLHYNGANSYLFASGKQIHKLKEEDSENAATPLCLGNVLKGFSVDNMNKSGLNSYVYEFSINYDDTVVADVLDIHKYLMKKNRTMHNV